MRIEHYAPDHPTPHAIIREDDTQGVLAPEPEWRPVTPSLDALEAAAMASPGREPGTVVVIPGRPLAIRAVIHDLDQEPTWREEWIVRAAVAALTAASHRGLTAIATPLLGRVHARVPLDRGIALMARALDDAGPARPATLWLEGEDAEVAGRLRRLCDGSD